MKLDYLFILVMVFMLLFGLVTFKIGFIMGGGHFSSPVINYTNSDNFSLFVNGLYNSGYGYVVLTANRSVKDISTTESHELCHALIFDDYDHFCNY